MNSECRIKNSSFGIRNSEFKMHDDTLTKLPNLKDRLTSVRSYL